MKSKLFLTAFILSFYTLSAFATEVSIIRCFISPESQEETEIFTKLLEVKTQLSEKDFEAFRSKLSNFQDDRGLVDSDLILKEITDILGEKNDTTVEVDLGDKQVHYLGTLREPTSTEEKLIHQHLTELKTRLNDKEYEQLIYESDKLQNDSGFINAQQWLDLIVKQTGIGINPPVAPDTATNNNNNAVSQKTPDGDMLDIISGITLNLGDSHQMNMAKHEGAQALCTVISAMGALKIIDQRNETYTAFRTKNVDYFKRLYDDSIDSALELARTNNITAGNMPNTLAVLRAFMNFEETQKFTLTSAPDDQYFLLTEDGAREQGFDEETAKGFYGQNFGSKDHVLNRISTIIEDSFLEKYDEDLYFALLTIGPESITILDTLVTDENSNSLYYVFDSHGRGAPVHGEFKILTAAQIAQDLSENLHFGNGLGNTEQVDLTFIHATQ